MSSSHSTHQWISAFCAHLMKLDPTLEAPAAVRRAVAAYPYSDDLPPEKAASMFVAPPARLSTRKGPSTPSARAEFR